MKIYLNKNNNRDVFKDVYGENKQSAEDLSGNLYMDVNTLVLSKEEHNRILGAQQSVVELFKDMERIIRVSPDLLEWLGIPKNLWEDVVKKRITNLTSYGRFDWMFDKEGYLQLLEFNAETPFGWTESIDYQNRLYKYFNGLKNVNTEIGHLLTKSVYKSLHEQGFRREDRIAIIGDLMDEEEYETFNTLSREIGYDCKDVFIDSIVNLKAVEDEIYLEKGDKLYPIDFLQTFYSCEWMAYDEGSEDFVNALKQGILKLVNPTSTLVLHSKGLFALIWYLYSEEGILQEHASTIENHIPYTSFLEEDFEEAEKFISKPLNYREGSGVEIRNRVSNIEDDNLIYQEYIDSVEIEYPLSDKYFNRRSEMLKATIGTFLINDEFGGYYSRLSKEICSSQFAVFTPTFIEEI